MLMFKFLDNITLERVIYLSYSDDSLAIRDNFLVALIPGNLGVRGFGLDIKLHCVLLNAVDGLQFGGEGMRVGINLAEIGLTFNFI